MWIHEEKVAHFLEDVAFHHKTRRLNQGTNLGRSLSEMLQK